SQGKDASRQGSGGAREPQQNRAATSHDGEGLRVLAGTLTERTTVARDGRGQSTQHADQGLGVPLQTLHVLLGSLGALVVVLQYDLAVRPAQVIVGYRTHPLLSGSSGVPVEALGAGCCKPSCENHLTFVGCDLGILDAFASSLDLALEG